MTATGTVCRGFLALARGDGDASQLLDFGLAGFIGRDLFFGFFAGGIGLLRNGGRRQQQGGEQGGGQAVLAYGIHRVSTGLCLWVRIFVLARRAVTCTLYSGPGTPRLRTLRATFADGAGMSFLIVLAALCFLMLVAYRGYSVILFAPVAALGAVLLTDPSLVAPMFTGLFMDKMVGFLKLYFPVFLLGAIFGKLIEISGFSKSIVAAVIRLFGPQRAMLSIVVVCALLTYGGVSLFVVVFAVYPFAAELFRQSDIPKRLIPGTIALGAFTFTMDALPGTPQIQNIIPASFFGTNAWAAPVLGTLGGVFILILGMSYLEWRRRRACTAGEGYGDNLVNEPAPFVGERLAHPLLALLPLLLVGVANKLLTVWIPQVYGTEHRFDPAVIGSAPKSCRKFPGWPRSGQWKVPCCLASSACCCLPGSPCLRVSPKAPRPPSAAPCWLR
ncbi:hypothetical protein [Dokdonella sp.]|uniref:GntP family permease n=1 Tax=Dokdonella sp. TaxID=2291710 RepID=UPI0025C5ECDD|nr:hypothetical protein [Dokdonella sp.]